MKRLRLGRTIGLFAVCLGLLCSQSVGALGPVLISGVQVKGIGTSVSSQEAVEVHNYSPVDVEVTNWCVGYVSYTSTATPTVKGCVVPLSANDKVFLRAGTSFVLATDELTAALRTDISSFTPDSLLSSGLSNDSGQLYLLDGSKEVQDNVKWNKSTEPVDGQANLKGTPENISFKRIDALTPTYQASPLPLVFASGGLYDVVDVCTNIEGFQEVVSDGYFAEGDKCYQTDVCPNIDEIQTILPGGMVVSDGNCVVDVCANLDGPQLILPENYFRVGEEDCALDACLNLDDLQMVVPVRHYLEDGNCLELENRFIELSELLPNAAGADTGLEYIELHNPYEKSVSLSGYKLQVSKNLESEYGFPDMSSIPAKGYFVVTNAQITYTLLNTNSQVALITPAGERADTVSYQDPKDDQSWSKIDGVWQYSNQKTPGSQNRTSVFDIEEEEVPKVSTLAPCGEGKYRHPLTNRCRNVESDVVTLASCDSDEYRNPDTNRCRKIASLTSSLTPCSEGQERNPETNRCRSVLSATSSLTPCTTGQERNTETNRCRKIPAEVSQVASLAGGESSDDQPPALSPYVIATGAAGLAIGYGVFEWRGEVMRLVRRLSSFKK